MQNFIGEHIGARDLDAWQAQSFLEHRRCVRSKASRDRAADIQIMGDIDCIGQDVAIDEQRLDDGEVTGMGAASIRIVGQQDIAIREITAELLDQRLDLYAERAGKQRDTVHLGNELTIRSQETAGKIEDFVDNRAHACSGHDDAHFIDGRHQLAFDDLLGHRINTFSAGGHRLRALPALNEGRLGVFGSHR